MRCQKTSLRADRINRSIHCMEIVKAGHCASQKLIFKDLKVEMKVKPNCYFTARRRKRKTHFKVKRLTYQIKHKINEIESVQRSQKILSKIPNE